MTHFDKTTFLELMLSASLEKKITCSRPEYRDWALLHVVLILSLYGKANLYQRRQETHDHDTYLQGFLENGPSQAYLQPKTK